MTLTHTCAICGQRYRPHPAATRREVCYAPDCMRERDRRRNQRTKERQRRRRGRPLGHGQEQRCSRCGGLAHEGSVCRQADKTRSPR